MSEQGVLIDGAQFFSKTATGIGSYGRTLARTLRASGLRTAVLYGRDIRIQRGTTPMNIAMQMFGIERPQGSRLTRLVRNASAISRLSGHILPREISAQGVDLSAIEPPLPTVDRMFNAARIYDQAHMIFRLRDRFTEIEAPKGIDLAHWTGPMAIKARNVPNVYTVHDLIPLQFPYFVVDRNALSLRLHEGIAKHADHIITVSEASKRHIVELLNVKEDRVSVTFQPTPKLPSIDQADAERLVSTVYDAEPGNYALFLGAIEPKKNLKRLIEAFLMANTGIPLLIAGPSGWLNNEETELISTLSNSRLKSSVEPRHTRSLVRRLGYLPRRHVTALLQCARFFVFPSIYEGFGLPVLEAMELGVPVLTSNTSSLPEVAGDAALLTDPLNIDDMKRKIHTLASDTDLRAELSQRGPLQAAKFSEYAYKLKLAEAYKKVGVSLSVAPTTPLEVKAPS